MEAEIQTTTPQGSPILAYGEVKGPKFSGRFAAALVGSLVLLFVCMSGGFLLFSRISLPTHTFLTVAFPGNAQLSDPLPRLWQNTATTSKFPFIAGAAKTVEGWQPFTVTFRGFGNAGSWTHPTRFFVIHADSPLELEDGHRSFEVTQPILVLGKHRALVKFNGENGSVEGFVDGSTWKTSTKIAHSAATDLGTGDIAVDFIALPESWSFFQSALNDAGIHLDQIPETLTWTESTSTLPSLRLEYGTNSPSTSTILALAAVAGQHEVSQLPLEDGTVADTLLLPTHLLTPTSSKSPGSPSVIPSIFEWRPVTGTTVRIHPHAVEIETLPVQEDQAALCPGRPIAHLSKSALDRVSERTHIGLDGLEALELVIEKGRLVICWK